MGVVPVSIYRVQLGGEICSVVGGSSSKSL